MDAWQDGYYCMCQTHMTANWLPSGVLCCTRVLMYRQHMHGTPMPMLIDGPYWHRYDTTADIWSFGILLYEIATGKAPYANMSLTKVILTTLHEEAPSLENTKGRKFSEV